jgi:poly(A) polymerase
MNKIFDDIYILLKDVFKGTIFEGHAFFVGGCVRDYINDLNPNDIDIVIDLKNESKSFCDILHSKLINATTEPFQLGHYPIYSIKFTKDFHYNEKFLKLNDISIEVAESMSERFNNNDSRQRDVEFASINDDIFRRDFSINSGLIDIISKEFIDYSGFTKNDIEKGIIRCNKNDKSYIDKIFFEDPLRILRGIIFSIRFNFEIDEETKNGMIRNKDRLSIVSKERIISECKKIFDLRFGMYKLVMKLDEFGILDYVFPGISNLKNSTQRQPNGDFDIRNIHVEGPTVFEHTLAVLQNIDTGMVNSLAGLYHDVGKIYTEHKNGKIRYLNHEKIGAKLAEKYLKEMKYDLNTINDVKFLIENHMLLHTLKDLSKKSLRRVIRKFPSDDLRFKLYSLCDADCRGTMSIVNGRFVPMLPHYDIEEKIEKLIKEDEYVTEKPFRYFNGHELMDILNIESGPLVKKAINVMYEIQDEFGPNLDKEHVKKLILKKFKK